MKLVFLGLVIFSTVLFVLAPNFEAADSPTLTVVASSAPANAFRRSQSNPAFNPTRPAKMSPNNLFSK